MRAASALKKDFSARKLSTSGKAPFDPEGLVRELLSLGNEKITPALARKLATEVQEELQSRSPHHWTPELISEIVKYKLEELGLLEIRSPRRTGRAGAVTTLKLPRGLFSSSEEEVTGDMPLSELGLDKLFQDDCTQPLANESLRRPPAETPGPKKQPLPPRVEIQLSPLGLRALGEKFPFISSEERLTAWGALLSELAARVADSEKNYPEGREPEVLAVEFFNAMANQEFLPHAAELLKGNETSAATPGIRVPLRADLHSQSEALAQCEQIFKSGVAVSLDLSDAETDALTSEQVGKFLEALDQSLFEKLGEPGRNPELRLLVSAEHPEARALAQLASSGRFFPKISLSLQCRESAAASPELFHSAWQHADLNLTWSHSSLSAGRKISSFGPSLEYWESAPHGSINLAVVASGSEVDWSKLRRIVRSGIHFLENQIDAASYPNETIQSISKANRKIGLGVLGFADLLIKLGIPYDSEHAVSLAEKLMRFIHAESKAASQELAKARPSRHAALNAVRPTNFFAELLQVAPGLEPLAQVVERHEEGYSDLGTSELLALLKQISLKHRVWTADLENDILERNSVRESPLAPKPLRRLFGMRSEIDPVWELKIAGAFQKFCDGTVEHRLVLPDGSDLESLFDILEKSAEHGLRALSLAANPEVPDLIEPVIEVAPVEEPIAEIPEVSPNFDVEALAANAAVEAAAAVPEEIIADEIVAEEAPPPEPLLPRARPEVMSASVRQIQTGCGPLTISLARDERGPYEIQARLGKNGSCESAQAEAISRLSSLLLGVGVDAQLIHEQLKGIRCPVSAIDRGEKILSCADAIATALKREYALGSEIESQNRHHVESDEDYYGDEEEITAVVSRDAIH